MKKSLISAVKKLLTKLGAEEIEGNNLVEVIDSGADAIEGGSGSDGGGVFFVTFDFFGTKTLDKTWAQIKNATLNGSLVVFIDNEDMYTGYGYLSDIESIGSTMYIVRFISDLGDGLEIVKFKTDSENGYPVFLDR